MIDMPDRSLTLTQIYVDTRQAYGPHVERAIRARLAAHDPHRPLSRGESRRVLDLARVAHQLEQELVNTASNEFTPTISWRTWLGRAGGRVQALLRRTHRTLRARLGGSSPRAR
jgi:hypothetical protein